MNNTIRFIFNHINRIKNVMHYNIYMVIGCYGVLAIVLLCLSTKWFYNVQITAMFEPLIPPAWDSQGEINHLLGTDQLGQDIFDYLLIAYKTTLVLAVKTLGCVIVISAIINYLIFFIKPLRVFLSLFLHLVIAIPPILTAIVVSLLCGQHINYILFIIGFSFMPRFVHNIHVKIMQEWQKTYITALRLDGVSSNKILFYYIMPNVFSIYLSEIVMLLGNIILTLTILTYLGFGRMIREPDLGIMMRQMLDIVSINAWAFLSPGIAIVMTILLINLLSWGFNAILTKRNRG